MSYSVTLSLHLIGVVSWFAGLFYLVRLFIYHSEALEKNQAGKEFLVPQFILMAQRLHNYITFPAAIFTISMGWMLMLAIGAHRMSWFQLKFGVVIGLLIYHGFAFLMMRMLRVHTFNTMQTTETLPFYLSSKFLRFYNELATILLALIVFLAVIKDVSSALTAFLYFLLVLVGLMVLFIARKKFKQKQAS